MREFEAMFIVIRNCLHFVRRGKRMWGNFKCVMVKICYTELETLAGY